MTTMCGVPSPPTSGDVAPAGRGGRPRDPSRDGAIRAAILTVLAEAGYAGLTMDAVATEAGVGKATIYRRWRTKTDLVADAVSSLRAEPPISPDTGSLEEDLRILLHWMVATVNGPLGAATLSLLSALPHEPELRAAFQKGPMGQWSSSFRTVWTRAEERGEVGAGVVGTAVATSASALILQRWLFSRRPVDNAYADEVLAKVVLPLVQSSCGVAH
ncbi:MAG: Transcriptional regulator, TetR family [Modestobacter sp.]|jgi:AcrR family transcriptional regulator|nr:Transcriptional regulator, TetR family [Modestobacter sp.]